MIFLKKSPSIECAKLHVSHDFVSYVPDVPDVPTCLKCSLPYVSACFHYFPSSMPSFFVYHACLQHFTCFCFYTCLMWPHFLRALRAFIFFTCFHFSSTFIILSALILLTCIRFSYMPSYFLCAFIFLVLCMLSYLTVFIFYVPSPFYVPTFYLRPFAFSICFHIFYVLLKWFTFFAYLTCLNFLHAALLCFIFYSQMPNKGGKGAIDWFFIFPVH